MSSPDPNAPLPSAANLQQRARRAFRFQQTERTPMAATAETTSDSQETKNFTSRRPQTRPRGRLLIALLMFLACSAGVFTVWDSLLRYQAYGVVTGRIIDISAPIDGVLQYVHVREGEEVRQAGRLATLFDLEYEQQLARVADELKVAQAELHAEIARVQWQSHVQETEMTKSMADFFEGASDMYEETATLGVIRNELVRTQTLADHDAARELDLQNQTIQEQAHTEKLTAIQKALNVLKDRAETAARIPRLGPEQIAPLIAKVDLLLHETKRLRDWLAQGDLRAPVNGIVLARHHPAGECIRSHEPLFSVMEESSLAIELFLPQDMTADYEVGDTVELRIEPFEELVPCTVTSIGVEHRAPPPHIEAFYRRDIRLLPVKLKPPAELTQDRRMSVGAVARLPYFARRS